MASNWVVKVVVTAAAGGTIFIISHSSKAVPEKIVMEAVNNYALMGMSNIRCREEAEGFYYGMTTNGSGWIASTRYYDNLVYDTDFRDPEVSGDFHDNDTINSDQADTAFTFICAHGLCDDTLQVPCSSAQNCTSGDICPARPPSTNSSACVKNLPRRLITSSTNSSHGNNVFYNDGKTKFGEAPGCAFAGAGTNGGTSVVFLDSSCSARFPWVGAQTASMFAGMIQLHLIMPVSNLVGYVASDNIEDLGRGSRLATYALMNPSSSVYSGWKYTIDNAPITTNSSCPDMTSNYQYGGGKGIRGCGAHVTVSRDSSSSAVLWNVNELNWYQVKAGFKPTGASWGYTNYACNYNCATYGFTK